MVSGGQEAQQLLCVAAGQPDHPRCAGASSGDGQRVNDGIGGGGVACLTSSDGYHCAEASYLLRYADFRDWQACATVAHEFLRFAKRCQRRSSAVEWDGLSMAASAADPCCDGGCRRRLPPRGPRRENGSS